MTGESNNEYVRLPSSGAAWNTARNLPLCFCINCQLPGITLHNAASSKQIAKAPASEVDVNDSSYRKPRGFLPALNRSQEGRREKTPHDAVTLYSS